MPQKKTASGTSKRAAKRKISKVAIEFAKRVEKRRQELGMSKLDLVRESGVSRQFLFELEKRWKEPTLSNADKIAKALKTTLAEMLRE